MESPPAFPRPDFLDTTGDWPVIDRGEDGMTLRDYYAGQALAGIMASPNFEWFTSGDEGSRTHSAAHFAYSFADAMLAAREQGQ